MAPHHAGLPVTVEVNKCRLLLSEHREIREVLERSARERLLGRYVDDADQSVADVEVDLGKERKEEKRREREREEKIYSTIRRLIV